MDNKTDLRVRAKTIRKGLDISLISANMVNLIRKNESYLKAQNIMLYYPMKYEINILSFLTDNINFYI